MRWFIPTVVRMMETRKRGQSSSPSDAISLVLDGLDAKAHKAMTVIGAVNRETCFEMETLSTLKDQITECLKGQKLGEHPAPDEGRAGVVFISKIADIGERRFAASVDVVPLKELSANKGCFARVRRTEKGFDGGELTKPSRDIIMCRRVAW